MILDFQIAEVASLFKYLDDKDLFQVLLAAECPFMSHSHSADVLHSLVNTKNSHENDVLWWFREGDRTSFKGTGEMSRIPLIYSCHISRNPLATILRHEFRKCSVMFSSGTFTSFLSLLQSHKVILSIQWGSYKEILSKPSISHGGFLHFCVDFWALVASFSLLCSSALSFSRNGMRCNVW